MDDVGLGAMAPRMARKAHKTSFNADMRGILTTRHALVNLPLQQA